MFRNPFTWVKTFQNPPLRLERRLDRVLCNSRWLSQWPLSSVMVHVRFALDHHPLVFSLDSSVVKCLV